jgi:hypothetical protein
MRSSRLFTDISKTDSRFHRTNIPTDTNELINLPTRSDDQYEMEGVVDGEENVEHEQEGVRDDDDKEEEEEDVLDENEDKEGEEDEDEDGEKVEELLEEGEEEEESDVVRELLSKHSVWLGM